MCSISRLLPLPLASSRSGQSCMGLVLMLGYVAVARLLELVCAQNSSDLWLAVTAAWPTESELVESGLVQEHTTQRT
jgi:hypothetical protein